ncbi:hypothetical protein OIU34_17370 [Pararhizobium sp. BT-229]|uniref:hypothetical protein n=1 Tax=Pararhizobium sp. BT-229 TaxID=2986923 RepID=UPI0021F74054|nr:hypothetical protein [Pararhizobium sp. BT-229]MCV9963673.1 hypothetical protein [Pararhizobium sp. BT-229]
MQFTIGKSTVNMEFPDSKDNNAVASAFLANPDVAAAVKEHAASFYFQAWDRDGDLDQSTINTVIGIALDKGTDAAADYMIENDFDVNPSDYFRACDGEKSTTKLIENFLSTFASENGIEEDSEDWNAFCEAVLERVTEKVEEQLSDTDKSSPADFFKRGDQVRISFIQGYETRGYIEDIFSAHADNTCQTDTVKPDRNLMLQFKLLNISPVEFVEYYKEKRGHDLANPTFGEGVSDYHRRQFLENAQAWRFACDVYNGVDVSESEIPDWLDYGSRAQEMAEVIRSCRDLDRPSAVSLETLETILDNATYGGVGTWYGRVSAKEIMQGQFENSFVATGGQIGVHDFINGSGYLTDVENDVLIDLRDGKLIGDARFRNNPESVYGFTRRALDGDTKGATLTDWVRHKDGGWRSCEKSEDGLYAEISLVGDVNGERKNFSIVYKNGDNQSQGDTFDFSGTLDAAKAYTRQLLVYTSAADQKGPAGPGL